jgi:hypothetical protein
MRLIRSNVFELCENECIYLFLNKVPGPKPGIYYFFIRKYIPFSLTKSVFRIFKTFFSLRKINIQYFQQVFGQLSENIHLNCLQKSKRKKYMTLCDTWIIKTKFNWKKMEKLISWFWLVVPIGGWVQPLNNSCKFGNCCSLSNLTCTLLCWSSREDTVGNKILK